MEEIHEQWSLKVHLQYFLPALALWTLPWLQFCPSRCSTSYLYSQSVHCWLLWAGSQVPKPVASQYCSLVNYSNPSWTSLHTHIQSHLRMTTLESDSPTQSGSRECSMQGSTCTCAPTHSCHLKLPQAHRRTQPPKFHCKLPLTRKNILGHPQNFIRISLNVIFFFFLKDETVIKGILSGCIESSLLTPSTQSCMFSKPAVEQLLCWGQRIGERSIHSICPGRVLRDWG